MGGVCLRFIASFSSHFVNQDGDETSIYDSAQALVTLQKLFGPFPRILGKGTFAFVRFQHVADLS